MADNIEEKQSFLKKQIMQFEADIHFYEEYKQELLKDIENKQNQIKRLDLKTRFLNQKYQNSVATYENLSLEIQKLTNDINQIDYGIYKPIYNFNDSEKYKKELEYIIGLQKEMIKEKSAAICSTTWTIDGSTIKGRSFVDNNIQLILRAFNGDCNAIMAKVRWDNYELL